MGDVSQDGDAVMTSAGCKIGTMVIKSLDAPSEIPAGKETLKIKSCVNNLPAGVRR